MRDKGKLSPISLLEKTMHAKYFTITKANEMIPKLERVFFRIYQIKGLAQATFHRLEELGFAPEDEHFRVHPDGADLSAVDALASLKMLMLELTKQIEQLTDVGCLVRDLSLGLIDFHAQKSGRDIFLCWKLGEKSITHWHEVDCGFEGRKLLPTRSLRKVKSQGTENAVSVQSSTPHITQ